MSAITYNIDKQMYEYLDTAVSFTGAIADSLDESKKKKKYSFVFYNILMK